MPLMAGKYRFADIDVTLTMGYVITPLYKSDEFQLLRWKADMRICAVQKILQTLSVALLISVSLLGVSAKNADAQSNLLFDEEFNGTTVQLMNSSNLQYPWPKNEKTWNIFDNMINPNDPKNSQNYFLRRSALTESDGSLHVSAQKAPFVAWPTTHPHTFDYISGRLESTAYFTHGYFEFRAKLPYGQGFWPALWLFAEHKGEIDLYEGHGAKPEFASNIYYHQDQPITGISVFPNPFQGNLVSIALMRGFWGDKKALRKGFQPPFNFNRPIGDPSAAYHVYGVDWQTSGITFYLDGQPYFHTDRTITSPMRVIIDLSLGGAGGPVTSATRFPASLDIDYIRVYDHASGTPMRNTPTLSLSESMPDTYTLPPHEFSFQKSKDKHHFHKFAPQL